MEEALFNNIRRRWVWLWLGSKEFQSTPLQTTELNNRTPNPLVFSKKSWIHACFSGLRTCFMKLSLKSHSNVTRRKNNQLNRKSGTMRNERFGLVEHVYVPNEAETTNKTPGVFHQIVVYWLMETVRGTRDRLTLWEMDPDCRTYQMRFRVETGRSLSQIRTINQITLWCMSVSSDTEPGSPASQVRGLNQIADTSPTQMDSIYVRVLNGMNFQCSWCIHLLLPGSWGPNNRCQNGRLHMYNSCRSFHGVVHRLNNVQKKALRIPVGILSLFWFTNTALSAETSVLSVVMLSSFHYSTSVFNWFHLKLIDPPRGHVVAIDSFNCIWRGFG